MMDDIIVRSLLEQAKDPVQVAMSMVCKRWAAVARAYSMRYKTLGQATRANCSIAVSRLFSNDDPREILEYRYLLRKHIRRGQSRHFARFVGGKIYTLEPFFYVSKYGVGYVDWLIENKYFCSGLPVKMARAAALGCKKTIRRLRRTNIWATILYANGHADFCWPLRPNELNSVLEVADTLSKELLIKVLSVGRCWRLSPKVALALSAQEIRFFYGDRRYGMPAPTLYITDDEEKAEAICSVHPAARVHVIGRKFPICEDDSSYRLEILRKLGDLSVFDGHMIDCAMDSVCILPEHVEFVKGKLAPGRTIKRIIITTYCIY